MMAGLSFVLLGIIALAVDGSGLFLDKARFSQGLEQGALALVAENNSYRQNKSHSDVLRQDVGNGFTSSAEKLSAQQEKRNRELLRDIARHYYYPSGYVGNVEEIEDNYQFECKELGNQNITCQVAGNFDRPSWFYISADNSSPQLSFAKKINLASDTLYAQKSWRQEHSPSQPKDDKDILLDVMFVLDISGSMDDRLAGEKKINILIENVNKIATKIFNDNPSNRVGFVGYHYGARMSNRIESCVLPYILSDEIMNYEYFWDYLGIDERIIAAYYPQYYYKYSFNDYNTRPELAFMLPHFPDVPETLKMINSFSGYLTPYWFRKFERIGAKRCLGNQVTTDLWFSQSESQRFFSTIDNLKTVTSDRTTISGTLSSSGLIVASHLILKQRGFQYINADTVDAVRKKILIVVSDGIDEDSSSVPQPRYSEPKDPTVTRQLLQYGICDRIKNLLDSQQNPLVEPSVIGFIALGEKGNSQDEWKQCTKEFYEAYNSVSLLNAFSSIIGNKVGTSPTSNTKSIEEVGHSLKGAPQGWK